MYLSCTHQTKRQINQDRVVLANLKIWTLKKHILDISNKSAFSSKSKLYQQNDGVSMCSSLRPVLANIIMTELEDVM